MIRVAKSHGYSSGSETYFAPCSNSLALSLGSTTMEPTHHANELFSAAHIHVCVEREYLANPVTVLHIVMTVNTITKCDSRLVMTCSFDYHLFHDSDSNQVVLFENIWYACCSLLLTRSLLGFAGPSTQDQCPFPRRHRAVATRQRASSRVRCRWGLWQRQGRNRWGLWQKRCSHHPRRPWVCPHRARTTRVRHHPHHCPTRPPLHRNGWRWVQRIYHHVLLRSSGP